MSFGHRPTWPSDSWMGAGRSRRRILLAIAERLFPTRAASFSCVTPRSSSSTLRAKASSTGIELLPHHVLHQGQLQALHVGGRADDGRHHGEAGLLRRSPTPFARDQFVAVVDLADYHRLDDADRRDRSGRIPRERPRSKTRRGCRGFRRIPGRTARRRRALVGDRPRPVKPRTSRSPSA